MRNIAVPAALLLLLLAAAVVGTSRQAAPAPAAPRTEIERQARAQAAAVRAANLTTAHRGERCTAELDKARRAGLIGEIRRRDDFAVVTVGNAFDAISVDAKRALALEASCSITAGDPARCATLDFSDRRTGKTVARFAACRLEVL